MSKTLNYVDANQVARICGLKPFYTTSDAVCMALLSYSAFHFTPGSYVEHFILSFHFLV